MRALTLAIALSSVACFGQSALAQATDSLACTPKALEWEKIERSASIEQMRTFRADLPDICPALKTEIADAIVAAEARSAANDKAERDRLAAQQRAQAQRDLEAVQRELERQRQLAAQQQAELKRLQEQAQEAEKRAADEKAAREAEQKRQAELEAKREADRQAELKRQQQLAAQQQAARERAEQQLQKPNTERASDWLLGSWSFRIDTILWGNREGIADFVERADGSVAVNVDYWLSGAKGKRQHWSGDAKISGSNVDLFIRSLGHSTFMASDFRKSQIDNKPDFQMRRSGSELTGTAFLPGLNDTKTVRMTRD